MTCMANSNYNNIVCCYITSHSTCTVKYSSNDKEASEFSSGL